MHNAKAGGEIGANGEFYKGGQFVADTEDWVKGSSMTDAERRDTVSVWYECHDFWTISDKWDEAEGKYMFDYAAVGGYGHSKESEGDNAEAYRVFFSYMLKIYLANHGARMPREEFWNRYAAAFGMDGIWLKNARYHGKPVVLFVTLDADGLAAMRREMEEAVVDVKWREEVDAEREAARRAAIVSKHIGDVGEKMERDVEVAAMIPFESQYGGGIIYKFKDGEGNVLVWATSTGLNRIDGHCTGVGDKMRIKFTVKGHDTYADEPQTKIVRVKTVA